MIPIRKTILVILSRRLIQEEKKKHRPDKTTGGYWDCNKDISCCDKINLTWSHCAHQAENLPALDTDCDVPQHLDEFRWGLERKYQKKKKKKKEGKQKQEI